MANSNGRKNTSTRNSSRNSSSNSNRDSVNRSTRTSSTRAPRRGEVREKVPVERTPEERAMFHEIYLIIIFIACVFLFLCNFHIIGSFGNFISSVLFGLFGFTAYIAPVLTFLLVAFWFANVGRKSAGRKLVAMLLLVLMFGVICELIHPCALSMDSYSLVDIFKLCKENQAGGGILAGSLAYLLYHYLEIVGTVLVVLLICAICIIILTERSLINLLKNGGQQIKERGMEDYNRRKEYNRKRHEEQEAENERLMEEQRRKAEEEENEILLRREKKVQGVMLDTSLKPQTTEVRRENIHEIEYKPTQETVMDTEEDSLLFRRKPVENDVHPVTPVAAPVMEEPEFDLTAHDQIRIHKEGITEGPVEEAPSPRQVTSPVVETPRPMTKPQPVEQKGTETPAGVPIAEQIAKSEKKVAKKYMFPPLSRLQKGTTTVGDSSQELKETALRLQQTLNTFGVKVTVTDISQGPSVTRYELQPELGVKVSKIVGLTDDIKLNLAATDIRIEAPIPGKAAVGIEIPNKENQMVALRDLLEAKEFKEFNSNLAFAVGKDIGGKTIVTDIAKMPHMLIAGSTGSGKSVCINTLIMSILYKAHPDDVKLIMVDPKVVELSVYNGIPHLLIPVVTDPKKASAALHWAVSEMEDRYRKFADFNVRDLKGYNQKLEEMREAGTEPVPNKLPQIVIIVDELADLMMVAPGEVEESICRLAQLARACGIHLIIATQRPSVDVITGLIKANMPSRVAFAVSSGVDSRTILDQVGAEKLLGKGDMLFYPQGYSKPARIQGAFVSDKEVSDVVDFLKNQAYGNVYAEEIEEQIKNIGTSAGGASGAASGGAEGNGLDEYFAEAGRFIIDKDKASIGSLQRLLKIGFNRAARIMDQLCEYGVVGEEEGTKPRKVLMSMEQFEQLLEEI